MNFEDTKILRKLNFFEFLVPNCCWAYPVFGAYWTRFGSIWTHFGSIWTNSWFALTDYLCPTSENKKKLRKIRKLMRNILGNLKIAKMFAIWSIFLGSSLFLCNLIIFVFVFLLKVIFIFWVVLTFEVIFMFGVFFIWRLSSSFLS